MTDSDVHPGCIILKVTKHNVPVSAMGSLVDLSIRSLGAVLKASLR